jgi:hypothetical protein
MKKINISTPKHPNTFALVNDEDFKSLNAHKWYANEKREGKLYACRSTNSNGKETGLLMHVEIMGTIKGKEVDHRSGDTLDNQRKNLRHCTNAENQINRGPQRNNKSGYKGVCWSKRDSNWRAHIKYSGKTKNIGSFTCLIKAAKAYDKKAKELFGEFAYLNFP